MSLLGGGRTSLLEGGSTSLLGGGRISLGGRTSLFGSVSGGGKTVSSRSLTLNGCLYKPINRDVHNNWEIRMYVHTNISHITLKII